MSSFSASPKKNEETDEKLIARLLYRGNEEEEKAAQEFHLRLLRRNRVIKNVEVIINRIGFDIGKFVFALVRFMKMIESELTSAK